MRTIKTLTLLVLLLASGSRAAWAQKKADTQAKVPFDQFVEKHFDRWDHNHDGVLTLDEVDHKVEDHSVVGREAAAIFRIRERMTAKGNPPHLSQQQLLSLAKNRGFEKSVEATTKQLETINRELFLPTDPDLSTFHQGRLGDCYLLCTIAAQVHRNPKPIRDMIHPVVTGGFQVAFGNGQKIQVARLTDTELLLGARMDSRHGSWLAVFEKAYGVIRKNRQVKKSKKPADAVQVVPEETLNGGCPAEIISLLTGRQTSLMDLGKAARREPLHNLLADTTRKRRLICISAVIDKPPPGVIRGHCYAIFGYDVKQRRVNIFNPWGNDFTPKGASGMANGYPTKHGLFTVPLDQFQQVFTQVIYEIDKPLGKRRTDSR
jgi:hypothetical protein